MGIASTGTSGSVPWSRVAAVPFAQGIRGLKKLPVGARTVFSSLMTEMSSGSTCWVESQPSLTMPAALHPTAPLSGWAQVPSFCLFLHPREQWKKQSPVFGCRGAFLPSESQTISTTGPGIFTGGHIAREGKKGFLDSWENGEGKLSFLSLRNLGATCMLATLGVQQGSATRLDLVLRTHPNSHSLCLQRPYSLPPSTFLC